MKTRTLEHHRRGLLACSPMALTLLLAMGLSTPDVRALPKDFVRPEPGLYRVDLDSKFGPPDGALLVTGRRDGASGDESSKVRHGTAAYSYTHKGSAEVTRCIAAENAADVIKLLPAMAIACKQDSVAEVADGVIVKSTCPSGTATHTMRRLGQGRWEFISESTFGGANGATSLAFMAPALEAQVRNGPTPEARAKAAKQLAALPQMQAQMTNANAQLVAKLQSDAAKASNPADKAHILALMGKIGSTPITSASSRTLLTKISDICP